MRCSVHGVWVLAMVTAGAIAAPPMVVSTTPADGDRAVDANLRRIVIEFDRDMDTRIGHSICGGGDSFPPIVGRPRWVGRRTFAFQVRLEPGHEYRFSVNCDNFQNFRSLAGEPAEAYPVRFHTAPAPGNRPSDKPDGQLTEADNDAAIAVLRESIDNWYAYRDRLGLDWGDLFERYSPAMRRAKTPREFAAAAAALLSSAKDKHVWLTVDGELVPSHVAPVTPNANAELLPRIVPGWQAHGKAAAAGTFEDGVGYLLIDTWSDSRPISEYMALWDFLARHAEAPGLVIDVRFNGGGNETLARLFAGCFVDDAAVYARHVLRDPDSPGGFSRPYDRVVHPTDLGPGTRYAGPVALLIGPVVMSSAEDFVLMMKASPRVTTFGDTTQGSSGNPQPYGLGNGVTVYLPIWMAMTVDGRPFEGVGITPDVQVPARRDGFSSADPVLDAALAHLRQQID